MGNKSSVEESTEKSPKKERHAKEHGHDGEKGRSTRSVRNSGGTVEKDRPEPNSGKNKIKEEKSETSEVDVVSQLSDPLRTQLLAVKKTLQEAESQLEALLANSVAKDKETLLANPVATDKEKDESGTGNVDKTSKKKPSSPKAKSKPKESDDFDNLFASYQSITTTEKEEQKKVKQKSDAEKAAVASSPITKEKKEESKDDDFDKLFDSYSRIQDTKPVEQKTEQKLQQPAKETSNRNNEDEFSQLFDQYRQATSSDSKEKISDVKPPSVAPKKSDADADFDAIFNNYTSATKEKAPVSKETQVISGTNKIKLTTIKTEVRKAQDRDFDELFNKFANLPKKSVAGNLVQEEDVTQRKRSSSLKSVRFKIDPPPLPPRKNQEDLDFDKLFENFSKAKLQPSPPPAKKKNDEDKEFDKLVNNFLGEPLQKVEPKKEESSTKEWISKEVETVPTPSKVEVSASIVDEISSPSENLVLYYTTLKSL